MYHLSRDGLLCLRSRRASRVTDRGGDWRTWGVFISSFASLNYWLSSLQFTPRAFTPKANAKEEKRKL